MEVHVNWYARSIKTIETAIFQVNLGYPVLLELKTMEC